MVKDWFLATEAALANSAASLTELLQLAARFDPATHHGTIRGAALYPILSFCAYVIVMALHQQYENGTPREQFWWLAIGANALCLLLMFGFILAVKGVSNG